jgi:DNA repair exonuclease SbcCD ATPase subunit
MVTNPQFFASMKWQDQREQLFQLAGTITDAEIAAKTPEFAALLDKITGKGFVDFKREIAARKKKLKDELEQIQPRIDQTQKLMPENYDFAAMEAQIADLEKQVSDIDKAIADKSEANSIQNEARQRKQTEINNLKNCRQQVLFETRQKAKEEWNNSNASAKEALSKFNSLKRESELTSQARSREMNTFNEALKTVDYRLKNITGDINRKRAEWEAVNKKEYNPATDAELCPNCGFDLHQQKNEDAKAKFNELKTGSLERITNEGKQLLQEEQKLEKDREDILNGIEDAKVIIEKEKTDFSERLLALQAEINANPQKPYKEPESSEIPEYVKLSDEIQTLEAELQKMQSADPSDTGDLRAKKISVLNEVNPLKNKLYNRDLIEKYGEEIKSLEAKGKELAQQIADVEREEYTIQQFNKERIDECERRINGLFKHVTFRLFDYTIEGNEYETCVPLVNGVPFDVANTAGQINAGLDIINALVRFHNVCAPIFIDRRESVNRIIPTESQIINLVVTLDNNLIIK